MSLFYKISIDRVNIKYISGWCFSRFRPGAFVLLQCWLDDTLIAETTAGQFREDLLELGIHPTGFCGFEFLLPDKYAAQAPGRLIIREKKSGARLAAVWPGAGRIDYRSFRHKINSYFTRRQHDRAAVFMHVPKTAGTSFNAAAFQMYPKSSIITHIELIEQDRYPELAKRYQYISGHLHIGHLKTYFPSETIDFYTIIREPYSQLHSHLKWLVQTAADQQDNYFRTNNPVIFQLGKRLSGTDLGSSSSLAAFVSQLSELEAAFLDNMQTRYFIDHQVERVTDNDLQQALENGQRFKLIGCTENYPAFVEGFARINKLKAARLTRPMNRSSSNDLFDHRSEDVRSALLPLVWADLALHARFSRPQA